VCLSVGRSACVCPLLVGVPSLLDPSPLRIFTYVIVAWASIYHTTVSGARSTNPFAEYHSRFIAVNSVICGALALLFVGMCSTTSVPMIERLNNIGVALTCAVEIGFAIAFSAYGGLLVHSFASKDRAMRHYVRKLGVVAVTLSLAFALSATALIDSIVSPSATAAGALLESVAYFGLDLLGLMIVLGLFASSISSSIAARNSVESVHMSAKGVVANSSDEAQAVREDDISSDSDLESDSEDIASAASAKRASQQLQRTPASVSSGSAPAGLRGPMKVSRMYRVVRSYSGCGSLRSSPAAAGSSPSSGSARDSFATEEQPGATPLPNSTGDTPGGVHSAPLTGVDSQATASDSIHVDAGAALLPRRIRR
jgi:hypothetical protein